MRPIADLGHSAYDTLEFIKEHYPEMVQMYETIMAHLKVPAGSSSGSSSDTHVAYTITDVFDTIIIDPDVIHNTLDYTDEEIPIMAKRAGLKYLGLYNLEAKTFTSGHVDYSENPYGTWVTDTLEYPARQVPMFAILKGEEPPSIGYSFSYEIVSIPVNHKRTLVTFNASHQGSGDQNFENGEAVADTAGKRKGILWNCAYAHQCVSVDSRRSYRYFNNDTQAYDYIYEDTTYGIVARYDCEDAILNQVTTTVTTLIDVNDEIDLPEVL